LIAKLIIQSAHTISKRTNGFDHLLAMKNAQVKHKYDDKGKKTTCSKRMSKST
jgi:hypothetical protein